MHEFAVPTPARRAIDGVQRPRPGAGRLRKISTALLTSLAMVAALLALAPSPASADVGPGDLDITQGVVSTDNNEAVLSGTAGGSGWTAPGTIGTRFDNSISSDDLDVFPITSDVSGVDAGDLVTFAIAVENNAPGPNGPFDVEVAAEAPSGFVAPAGGINLAVRSGPGNPITFADLGGGLLGAGILLDDTGTGSLQAYNPVSGENIAIITYDLEAVSTVAMSATTTGTASLLNYAATDGGAPEGADSDSTDVTIAAPFVDKSLTSTNQAHTTSPAIAIGETATYDLAFRIPEGETVNVNIIDALSPGQAFVSFDALTADPAVSSSLTFPVALAGAAVDGEGDDVLIDLGTVTNSDVDNATDETLTLTYTTVALNDAVNQLGTFLSNSGTLRQGTTQLVDADSIILTVNEPVLTVDKVVSPLAAEVGDTVLFTVTVAAPVGLDRTTAFDVVMEDVLPAGYTYVPASLNNTSGVIPNTFDEDTGVITATYTSLSVGNSSTLEYSATVDGGATGDLLNEATLEYTSLPGDVGVTQSTYSTLAVERTGDVTDVGTTANDLNDTDDATVGVETADVSVAVTDGITSVTPGETITYTITATNLGAGAADDVVLTNQIPNGTTFVEASDDATEDAGLVTWPSFDLEAAGGGGATATRTITIFVGVSVPAGFPSGATSITDTATATTPGDSDATNDTATDVDTLVAAPDLALTKTDGDGSATPGETTTYTLSVQNVGDQGASGVTLTDTLPDEATFVSASNGGTLAGNVVTWPTFGLAVGATATRTVTVTLDDPFPDGTTEITNTAEVSDNGANGPEASLLDNVATDVDSTLDVVVAVTDGTATATPGQTLTYTITATNLGGAPADDVALTNAIPAGTTFVEASDGGTEDGGLVTWATFDLLETGDPDDSATRTVTVTVDDTFAAGVISLTNTASATTPGDADASNDTATDIDTLDAAPDLGITKTDGNDLAAPGQTTTYTITVTNDGEQGATGVLVTDTLPAEATFVSASDGGTHLNGVVTWPTFGLAVGDTVDRSVTVTLGPLPAGDAAITNAATVTDDGANGTDTDLDNNTATDVDGTIDVGVTITNDDTSLAPGDTTIYMITVQNDGGFAADDVLLTNAIPAGTTFVSASDGGTEDGGLVTWPTFDLSGTGDEGDSTTLTVTVIVDDTFAAGVEDLTTTATVVTTDDANALNDTATDVDTLVAAPDIAVNKTDGDESAVVGEDTTYTLTVTNPGEQGATGVALTDTLPADTTFVSASDGGTHLNGVVTWPDFDIVAGETVLRTVTIAIDDQQPGTTTVTNTASATDDGANGIDTDLDNNTATDVDQTVDIAVTVTDGVTSVVPGDTVTYTIVITNLGATPADDVALTNTIPAGTTFETGSDGATAVGDVVSWPEFNLTAADGGGDGDTTTRTVTVFIGVNVPAGFPAGVASLTDTAVATVTGDFNTANNTATDVNTLVATPDLGLMKTDGDGSAVAGENTTYTLTIQNSGNQGAAGVVLTDTLPDELTFVSATGGGTHSNGTVTWPTFGLAAGGTTTRTLTVTVENPLDPGTTTITNTASVADDGANGTDPDLSDNTATDVDGTVDVAISVTDGMTVITPGTTTTYTVTIDNLGAAPADDVLLTNAIPAGTTFVEASDGGTEDEGVVTWPTFDLTAADEVETGDSTTRTVTVTLDATFPVDVETLTDTATASTPGDFNAVNDTATDVNTLDATPDLRLEKSDGTDLAVAGADATYTLSVANDGVQDAAGVALTDTLPENATFVEASDGGTEDEGVVTWPTFDLAAGDNADRTVTVTFDDPLAPGDTTVTNAAAVTDDGTNGDDSNPDDNTATDVNGTVDLAVMVTNGVTTVEPGDSLTYTVTVSNLGASTADEVLLANEIPAGTTFVEASDGGTEDEGVVTWPAFDLTPADDEAATDTTTRTVTVVVDDTFSSGVTSLTDTATATHAADTNVVDNTATDVDTLAAAPDLVVDKTDDDTDAAAGDEATYTITISNVGNQDATGVSVTDTLPATTTFVSADSGGTLSGSVVTWPDFDLDAGDSVERTVTVTVNDPLPSNTTSITNTATATDDGTNGTDPTSSNNTDTDTNSVGIFNPFGSLDVVRAHPSGLAVVGWAIDPNTVSPIDVHVYLDGSFVGAHTADVDRPDLAGPYPDFGSEHGYSIPVSAAPGAHSVCTYAINDQVGGANTTLGCATFTVTADPVGAFDSVVQNPEGFRVRGWAIEPSSADPAMVHIYVDGGFAGAYAADAPRPDLGAIFPEYGVDHGLDAVVTFVGSGSHSVCAYAFNEGAGANTALGCRTVDLAVNPFGALDSVRQGPDGHVATGWGIEPNEAGALEVHLYVDGGFAGVFTTDTERPDLGAAFPEYGSMHGYVIPFPVSGPGSHTACTYGINAGLGTNVLLGCNTFTSLADPFGSFDSATASADGIVVSGWAIDPNSEDAVVVHVYVDGAFIGAPTADQSRPDVGGSYPEYGDDRGFSMDLGYGGTGTHTACSYAIDIGLGDNVLLGCRSFSR